MQILVPNDFGKLAPLCSQQSIRYLEDSMKRLEGGVAPTPSFKLYGKTDVALVEKFIEIASRKVSVPEWVLNYERKRLEKFAPQGGIPKWDEVKEDFLLYKTRVQDVSKLDTNIVSEMRKHYRAVRAQMLAAEDTLKYLINSKKIEARAAGWSEFQLKKTDPKAQKIALDYCKRGLYAEGYGYTFTRLVKKKLRIFMPMPFSLMIEQARYFVPCMTNIQSSLRALSSTSPFTFWSDKIGFESCFDIMQQEIQQAKLQDNEKLVYYTLDFDKMDTTCGPSQYENIVIPITSSMFGYNAMPTLHKAFMLTTTTPIISPSGTMLGPHGTASGAETTNFGECIINDYVQRRVIKILGQILPHGWRIIVRRGNGDDSVLIFAITVDLDTFKASLLRAVEQAVNEVGLKIQIEKQDISDTHGFFCQHIYWYDTDTKTVKWMYPTSLVLNSIINPSKEYKPKDWDKDYRDIDIIEKLDNTVHHPWYDELVRYVSAGMKYPLLQKSEEETKRILSKYDKYRSLQSLNERYNRQDYDISKSPIIKALIGG